jgi:hypothetical protein
VSDTCKVYVYDRYSSHACGRKLKGDPDYPGLCGIHVGARRRQKQKDEEQVRSAETARQQLADATARAAALTSLLGVEITVGTSFSQSGPEAFIRKPNGYARVRMDDLAKIVARIEELEGR